jgi:hypothetical protein
MKPLCKVTSIHRIEQKEINFKVRQMFVEKTWVFNNKHGRWLPQNQRKRFLR